MSRANRPPDPTLIPAPLRPDEGPFVDEIFEAVVALKGEARERELVRLASGDPSLMKEVRALLRADQRATAAAPAAPGPLEAGQQLGPWVLSECLGSGTSGSVWMAFDRQLQRWSALKVVHPHHGGAPLEAVLTEARAASRIISDHVVRVKRAGQVERPEGGEFHYVEMELCAEHRARPDGTEELVVGQTLGEIAPRGQREAVRLVMEAARGVEAAHRIGVLHRDIKPANILVTPVSRRALVADFGLSASQLYPAPGPETPATSTVTFSRPAEGGTLVGTPSYMAPEQAFGHPPQRTSDVYGLGATLYALLAGTPPYMPRPGAAIGALDVVQQVQREPPAPLRTLAPRVSRRLERIVQRAMARSPHHRYPTAGALADDLSRYLADLPTSVDGLDPLLRIHLFTRRNLAAVTATGIMALIVAIFAGAVWQLDQRRVQIEDQMMAAQLRRDEAEEHATLSEARASIAEAARRRAERERREAIADARAALAARDRAERGAHAAEARAQQEQEQRWLAEEERARAEKLLEGETDLRLQLQTALHAAQDRFTDEKLVREWVETLLREEERARAAAEVARDEALRSLEETSQARDAAHQALEEAEQRLATLRQALEEAQEEHRALTERLAQLEAERTPWSEPRTATSEPDEASPGAEPPAETSAEPAPTPPAEPAPADELTPPPG